MATWHRVTVLEGVELRNSSSSSKGFTLIEMSVVLVIIGLLMVAAFSLGTSQLTLNRIATTKTKQDAVKNALMSFILRNNRLPCPAIATLTPGAVGYGVEAANAGVCSGTNVSGGVSTGVLPWSSLGLSDEGAQDAYYRRFTYQVTTAATGLNANTVAGMVGNISVHTGTPVVMGNSGIGNQSNDCANGLTVNPCAAVAAIISHGADAFGSYNVDGVRSAMGGGSDEAENANDDGHVVVKDFSTNTANPFDDIVMALSPNDLLAPLIKDGGLKSAQARVGDLFEHIVGAIATYATTKRSANSPGARNYPLPPVGSAANTLINATSDSVNDPWGKPVRYTLTTSPIDSNYSLFSAFTLTSAGPDGVFGSGDDLVRIVSVSEMQAIFSTYGW